MALMLAALFAAALATPPIVATPPATPPAVTAPLAPPKASKPAEADDVQAPLADLEQIYQQTCADRAYGAYDDVCNQLHDQLRQAERDDARRVEAERRHMRANARGAKPQSMAEKPFSGPL